MRIVISQLMILGLCASIGPAVAQQETKNTKYPDPEKMTPKDAEKAHGRTNAFTAPEKVKDPEDVWGFAELDPEGKALDSLLKDQFVVVIFNKAKNRVYLARYAKDKIELVKSYHALFGKLPGDKVEEGDLKTPEGIYYFNSFAEFPQIKRRLGKMAVGINYPNPVDKLQKKTGYDILLHATFEDDRLKLNFDSEGCVVTSNKHVETISKYIKLGVTPMLVYDNLNSDHLDMDDERDLQIFFKNWLASWNGKDIEGYMSAYSTNFVAPNGYDWKGWKNYKNALNKRYKYIDVKAENVKYFIHPKYNVIAFKQNYKSNRYKSIGQKFLYVERVNGTYKILSEDFSRVVDSPALVSRFKDMKQASNDSKDKVTANQSSANKL